MSNKNVFNSSLLGLLFLFLTGQGFSQTSYSLESELIVQSSNREELPFWMHSNQRGRISEHTNLAGLLTGKISHLLRNERRINFGAGALVHDGFIKKLALDELYAQYIDNWVYVTAGVKQKEQLYRGLSASNENILLSLNARPLPGVEIGTIAPIFLSENLGFEASWAEYVLEKERHVPYARVHHKSLHLVFEPIDNWKIRAGIQHFAQWGGNSSDKGKQPSGLTDYIRIVSGREGGEEASQGDMANSLGNHLGSWEFEIKKEYRSNSLAFIFNNIFEDGSGSRFANFPDGKYAVYFERENDFHLINAAIYEFYYTKDQSHDVNRWGADNYFNHLMTYNSGWSFHEKVIGAPFFLYDRQQDRIINNKFTAHHLGITGDIGSFFNPYPYRLMISYRHNEGSYNKDTYPYYRNSDIISTYIITRIFNLDFNYDVPRLTFDLIFAADINFLEETNLGAGLIMKYVIK